MPRFSREPSYPYSITLQQRDEFEQTHQVANDFFSHFKENEHTYYEKSIGLTRFFNWLRVVKQIDISPAEFLNMHLQKRASNDIEQRRWALRLALEYSRDNPDLKDRSKNYKYTAFFLPVKQFCDHHETPLTTKNGFFPKRDRRKYPEIPFTADFVRKLLGNLNAQQRAICFCELQAGQAIQQVLVDMNKQARRVFRLIDEGAERIRFDFDERKGNGFMYFSFISRDAIEALQVWRPIRQNILDKAGVKSDYLFITERGKPLDCKTFHCVFRATLIRKKMYDGPRSVPSHGLRKFFEQEASPPERGINKGYITFMMGHSEGKDSNGVKVSHPLDAVGGVYDNAPFVYPSVVEKQYAKLEPYINVYSGKAALAFALSAEDGKMLAGLLNKMKNGKLKISVTPSEEEYM
ncbi:MAG: site-specific integrase [Candidatus Bathyarchaeota archaeon]|nr:site-specific integrase [Candidatus Termitimicrobium sp.]